MMAFTSGMLFAIVSFVAVISPQLATANGEMYFTAATYEHVIIGNGTTDSPADFVNKNLDYYENAARTARSKGADIIVFPDYGFIPFRHSRQEMRDYLETIPNHRSANWNPCQQTGVFSQRPILRRLSCIARANQIVVVSQVGDVQPCDKQQNSKCPDDGFFNYNAVVAFDRDGSLIGVSRKKHPFFEASMDVPSEPQDPFFTTDFGTFAMYLRYDHMYKSAELAARNTSVDAIILSYHWPDVRPLSTAVQYQSSLAVGTGANVIAANRHYPGWISTGSGIYAGKMGAMKYTFNLDNKAKLIVSRVPKNRNQDRASFSNPGASITVINHDSTNHYHVTEEEEGRNIPDVCNHQVLGQDISQDYRCFHEPTDKFTFKKLTGTGGSVEACNNGLCCSASYDILNPGESFYLGVFNGTYVNFGTYFWCQEVCFVVRCDNINGSECNTFPAHSQTVFRRLELRTNLTTRYVYPSVLKSGYRLSPVDEWSFGVEEHDGHYDGRLTYDSESTKPLLNAALKGRCYDRDPLHFDEVATNR